MKASGYWVSGVVAVFVVVVAAFVFRERVLRNNIIREQVVWRDARITSDVTGMPTFDFAYPPWLPSPEVSTRANIEDIRFAASSTPGYVLDMAVYVRDPAVEPPPNLYTIAGSDISPVDRSRVEHLLEVDGLQAIAEAVSSSSPVTLYYVEMRNGSVLEFIFGHVGSNGASGTFTASLEDKIIESLKFETQRS